MNISNKQKKTNQNSIDGFVIIILNVSRNNGTED
jgi:hypothetical protein